jgi:hypothetical protein
MPVSPVFFAVENQSRSTGNVRAPCREQHKNTRYFKKNEPPRRQATFSFTEKYDIV